MLRFLVMGSLAVCVLASCSGELRAGEHVVRIEQALSSRGEDTGSSTKVRHDGFARAVLEEVQTVLGSKLGQARREAVQEILSPRVQRFVLSFSEQTFVEKQSKAVLQLNVRVNGRAIKSFLQRWGTYYTGSKAWHYVLRSPKLDSKARTTIQALELISGLDRSEKGEPVLELEQTDGSWRGELRFQGRAWKEVDNSLKQLWPSLWSNYFSLPGVQSRVLVGLELRVSGWSSFTGLKDFDRRMQSWNQLLDRATLQEVALQGQGVSGRWVVHTLHEEPLERSLQSFLHPRGLSFTLSPMKGQPEQEAADATRAEAGL